VLRCSGSLLPGHVILSQLGVGVTSPRVPWTSPLPLSPRVPKESLACGAGWWLPESVSNPAPLPLSDLDVHWLLFSSSPLVFIRDFLRPSDVKDAPEEAGVGLILIHYIHNVCEQW